MRETELPGYSGLRALVRGSVARKLGSYMSLEFLEAKDLAEALRDDFGSSHASAFRSISGMLNGCHPSYNGRLDNTKLGQGTQFSKVELLRVAKVLNHIGVEATDQLIDEIKREAPMFVYPIER